MRLLFVDLAKGELNDAHFGFALANLAVAEETNPDVGRRALAEADYQTRRALKLDPDNDEIKKLRDEVVKAPPKSKISPRLTITPHNLESSI
jgi:hypothetical protein